MPVFPDDLLLTIRQLQADVRRLFTSLAHSEPFTRLIARQMQVGQDAPQRRIIFNPDDAPSGSAQISMVPTGSSNAVRLIADTDAAYPNEALFHAVSGSSSSGDSELRMASGEVFMRIRDSGGSDAGGYAYWGRSEAIFGYRSSSSSNYFRFGSSICRHFGKWDDFASLPSNAGLLWGSITVGGSNLGWIIIYPATMQSNMGPIIGFRPGTSTDGKVEWAITASSTDRFTVSWSIAQSVAIYMCSFRH
ncbi:hypothetical protein IMZ11_02270 [Microtetraspora sp. AC03309]|uniref:hypothetical protein n=1 Tax=Microtetraspora sp. AC03309 TaxID=2779376 RepID=UPI001E5D0338|nr:hypothetical protein [Microtetraspora sp. AC03309]MCC5574466.1 hypothetical protein [Microtetraspora sp. AC03309]